MNFSGMDFKTKTQSVVVMDRRIVASGDYRSSPYFLRVNEGGRTKIIDLNSAVSPADARRIAIEKGFEPTHWIRVEGGQQLINDFPQ